MTSLSALCIGQPKPFRGEETSAIDKHPVDGRVAIRSLGLAGDAVADPKYHGGPEMAVHHYPHDHYPMWRDHLGAHDLLSRYGAFGEKSMYGKTVTGVIRSTFLVDADGTIELAQYNVRATGHVAKLRRDLSV